MLRKLPILLAALAGLALIAPAAQANHWDDRNRGGWNDNRGGRGRGRNIDAQQQRLFNQMQSGYNRGRLTQNEYNRLLSRYNNINGIEAQLRTGGLNPRERNRLNNQLQQFQSSLQWELNDRQGNWRGRW